MSRRAVGVVGTCRAADLSLPPKGSYYAYPDGKGNPAKPYVLRWKVRGRQRERSFATKGELNELWRTLDKAKRANDEFDLRSGLPVAVAAREEKSPEVDTVLAMMIRHVDRVWKDWLPHTRRTNPEGLAIAARLWVTDTVGMPADVSTLNQAAIILLKPTLSLDDDDVPAPVRAAGRWLLARSLPKEHLTKALVLDAIDGCGYKQDGASKVAASTRNRRKNAITKFLSTALDREELPDLLPRARRVTKAAGTDTSGVIDPAALLTAAEGAELVARIRDAAPHVAAFVGFCFVRGPRPAEARAVLDDDLLVPDTDNLLGRVRYFRGVNEPGKAHTDDGAAYSVDPLKWRDASAERWADLPVALLPLLRWHRENFPPLGSQGAPQPADERFRGLVFYQPDTGRPLTAYIVNKYIKLALEAMFPDEVDRYGRRRVPRKRAVTQYTLRHCAYSNAIAHGADLKVLSEENGTSVALINKTYRHAVGTAKDKTNAAMAAALSEFQVPAPPESTEDAEPTAAA